MVRLPPHSKRTATLVPYPTLFRSGLGGGFQAKAAPLLSAPTGFWALGPLSTVLNLFDGGRRRAQVDIRKADYDELAANYRQTVLGAFRDVEDARSEEHTSELQSLMRISYAVFCLKKKQKKTHN